MQVRTLILPSLGCLTLLAGCITSARTVILELPPYESVTAAEPAPTQAVPVPEPIPAPKAAPLEPALEDLPALPIPPAAHEEENEQPSEPNTATKKGTYDES